MIRLVIRVAIVLALPAQIAWGQRGHELYQQALVKERTAGQLQEAIALYERIVNGAANGDRVLAAKALVQLGRAYETLGEARAADAYTRVMRDFADQKDQAAHARVRLAALQSGRSDSVAVARRVWEVSRAEEPFYSAQLSRDGRFLAYIGSGVGELAMRELATGKTRSLTKTPYASFSPAISPDNREVLYAWGDTGASALRLTSVDAEAGTFRTISANPAILGWFPKEWFPDGRRVLVVATRRDRTNQIAVVDVRDSSVLTLRSLDWRNPDAMTMAVSPDGKWIAYSFAPLRGSRNRDLFLLAADGSGERVLVRHDADDFVIGWSPSGDHVVFGSDRTGSLDAWSIATSDGARAQHLRPALTGRPLGLTAKGTLISELISGWSDVFVADLDPASGKVTSAPTQIMQRNEGANSAPEWSVDGKRIMSRSSGQGDYNASPRLLIRSLDSGTVRELFTNAGSINFHFLRATPDGNSVLVIGPGEKGDYGHVLKVDLQTGEAVSIARPDSGVIYQPQISPDGGMLYFSRRLRLRNSIWSRDLATGVERKLYESPRSTWLSLSPDGRQLAFSREDTLNVMPATGGPARVVARVSSAVRGLTWSRDGQFLYYAAVIPKDTNSLAELWRVPVDGGVPEKAGLTMQNMAHLKIHPDGRRIAFTGKVRDERFEVWAIDLFRGAR